MWEERHQTCSRRAALIRVDLCVYVCVYVCTCYGSGRQCAQAWESFRTGGVGELAGGRVGGGQRDDEEEREEMGSFPWWTHPSADQPWAPSRKDAEDAATWEKIEGRYCLKGKSAFLASRLYINVKKKLQLKKVARIFFTKYSWWSIRSFFGGQLTYASSAGQH